MRVVWTTGVALTMAGVLAAPIGHASSHREAPITALDHKADITDFYAFRSYDGGPTPRVTLILCVDPLLEPANGPNWFPFDPDILYEIKVDNNNDAVEDVMFQFRFPTEQRLPGLFQAYAGAGGGSTRRELAGARAAGHADRAAADHVVRSAGLGTRQTLHRDDGRRTACRRRSATAGPLYAVPANVGPRTMDYDALFNAAHLRPGARTSTCSPARPTTRSGSTWAARSTR